MRERSRRKGGKVQDRYSTFFTLIMASIDSKCDHYICRALQEAQDIFGLDFDYGEFEKFGQEDYSEDDEADEYEDEYSDEEGQTRKRGKKKTSKKTIFDVSLKFSLLKLGQCNPFSLCIC